jgi:hypothetical protein
MRSVIKHTRSPDVQTRSSCTDRQTFTSGPCGHVRLQCSDTPYRANAHDRDLQDCPDALDHSVPGLESHHLDRQEPSKLLLYLDIRQVGSVAAAAYKSSSIAANLVADRHSLDMLVDHHSCSVRACLGIRNYRLVVMYRQKLLPVPPHGLWSCPNRRCYTFAGGQKHCSSAEVPV